MRLIAAGDSFVWGSELADSPHGGPSGYSNSTFTALLAQQFHLNYVCVAYPGSTNHDILNQITNIPLLKNDFVIICWTWPSRSHDLHSDLEIIKAQEFLKTHGVSFLFTCADNCVITSDEQIDYSNWYLFPAGTGVNQTQTPRGFYQWARENKYMCGTQGHPLELAHQTAAQLIQGKFHEMVEKHLESNQIRNSIS